MRLLVATPYSPADRFDHAADDISRPFLTELARRVELDVYAASGTTSSRRGPLPFEFEGMTIHPGSAATPLQKRQRLQRYPFRLRAAWRRSHTDDVVALARRIKPDAVHVEYLDPSEILLRGAFPAIRTSITLHDIMTIVARQEARLSEGLKKPYRLWEWAQFTALEAHVLRDVDNVFTFSPRDAAWAAQRGASSHVLPMGLSPTEERWAPRSEEDTPVIVFAGAMDREPNVESARFLARQVMPELHRLNPRARLRIVGANPGAEVTSLRTNPGIEVVGRVASFAAEFARASVVAAPSMIEAGVLLKALTAMNVGAPVILNPSSAAPLVDLNQGFDAVIASSATEWAAAADSLIRDRSRSQAIGDAGRAYVRGRHSWSTYVERFLDVLEQ